MVALIKCTKCKTPKPPEAFSTDIRTPNGKWKMCKECGNKRTKARQAAKKQRNEDFKFQ